MLARTIEFLNTLGSDVDIWEIGNEVNGDWLGDTPSVVAKMKSAYDLVKSHGKTTALTLYYNENCWLNESNEIFTWAQTNVPQDMKLGLDYVWISYYEDECDNNQPDWPKAFQKLSLMFPNSKVGFGEIGPTFVDKKESYIQRFYRLPLLVPNYVGGYFWWYFNQDMVPFTAPLWNTLNTTIQ